jgi:CheY-like chemotaxis protein/HPt (histidine-containing phosphotransfer) domain-containing protein
VNQVEVGPEDELLRLFEEEAAERLSRLSEQLFQLEEEGDRGDLLASIFRDAHSIKGAAAVVGLEDVRRVAQALESVLEPLWRGDQALGPGVVGRVRSAVDGLKSVVSAVVAGQDPSDRIASLERSLGAVSEDPRAPVPREPDPTARLAPDRPPRAGPAKPSGASVLVVDDTATVRELHRSILERSGYHVRTAADGAEALIHLSKAPYDLVLADIEMPRMDGLELTRAIRGEPSLASIPVIVLTSRSTEEDRARSLESGANAYLIKSAFDKATLLHVIEELLGGHP